VDRPPSESKSAGLSSRASRAPRFPPSPSRAGPPDPPAFLHRPHAGGQTCLRCPESEKFKRTIRDLTIKCVPWNTIPGTNISGCGFAGELRNGQLVPFTDTIILTPDGVDLNGRCRCLASIIMHEVLHLPGLRGPGHPQGQRRFDDVQRCFRTCRARGGTP
jgi:hypothetical protein